MSVFDENPLRGLRNRFLQVAALYAPGGFTLRAKLHRWRGVRMGSRVWIGTDALLETGFPHLVSIGNNVVIGIRATIIAHFREQGVEKWKAGEPTVVIEDDVFLGPNVTILPNVRIGRGSVVSAGSVVGTSVPAGVMVRGNPARPVARCGVPLSGVKSFKEFLRHMKPIPSPGEELS
ncbi:MAG: acyltransferase [Bacteroidota bacterium]